MHLIKKITIFFFILFQAIFALGADEILNSPFFKVQNLSDFNKNKNKIRITANFEIQNLNYKTFTSDQKYRSYIQELLLANSLIVATSTAQLSDAQKLFLSYWKKVGVPIEKSLVCSPFQKKVFEILQTASLQEKYLAQTRLSALVDNPTAPDFCLDVQIAHCEILNSVGFLDKSVSCLKDLISKNQLTRPHSAVDMFERYRISALFSDNKQAEIKDLIDQMPSNFVTDPDYNKSFLTALFLVQQGQSTKAIDTFKELLAHPEMSKKSNVNFRTLTEVQLARLFLDTKMLAEYKKQREIIDLNIDSVKSGFEYFLTFQDAQFQMLKNDFGQALYRLESNPSLKFQKTYIRSLQYSSAICGLNYIVHKKIVEICRLHFDHYKFLLNYGDDNIGLKINLAVIEIVLEKAQPKILSKYENLVKLLRQRKDFSALRMVLEKLISQK